MAGFVYLGRTPTQAGIGYRVVHFAPGMATRANLEDAVFAAFIKRIDEKVEFPSQFNGVRTEQRRIGNLELAVVHSELTHYDELRPSRSANSGALYAGHLLREGEQTGLLLQYLPRGAATTAHLHSHQEGYFRLFGLAFAYGLNGDAKPGEKAPEIQLGSGRRQNNALIVAGNTWHPLKGGEDSLIVIAADRSIVEDQVYGTRNNHHRSMSFKDFAKMYDTSGQPAF